MSIPIRPLGIIKDMVEAFGLDISYVYDDLIFIDHNAFLLQMGEKGEDIGVWFNSDSKPDDRPAILSRLQLEGARRSLVVCLKGAYAMNRQDNGETFQIELIPSGS